MYNISACEKFAYVKNLYDLCIAKRLLTLFLLTDCFLAI